MLINENNIFLNLEGSDKYEIFKNMIYNSDIAENIKNYAFQKVKEREELQSTCVGNGIGVAHARFDGMESIKVLMGVIKNGVDYDAIDEKPVEIVFIILAPKEKSREYLAVLSKISKVCRKKDLIEKIISGAGKNEIMSIIRDVG